MITYLKYVKVCYEKRVVTNCSPCPSCIRQDLLCSCREKFCNTRTISPAAGFLQVLHVMLSQEAMGVVETNICQGKVCLIPSDSRWTAQVIPCEILSSLTLHAWPPKQGTDQSFPLETLNTTTCMTVSQEGWSLRDKRWSFQICLAN